MNILYSTTPAKPLQKVSPPCFFFPLAATWHDYAITATTSNVTAAAIMTQQRLMAPHAHTNGHVSSAPPLHSHTTHTHRCDHHQHSHGHSHGHRCNHTYDCNHAHDNGNASFATPALARPHPLMGTLVAARHACAPTPSVGLVHEQCGRRRLLPC